jgi:hypothetical protein
MVSMPAQLACSVLRPACLWHSCLPADAQRSMRTWREAFGRRSWKQDPANVEFLQRYAIQLWANAQTHLSRASVIARAIPNRYDDNWPSGSLDYSASAPEHRLRPRS